MVLNNFKFMSIDFVDRFFLKKTILFFVFFISGFLYSQDLFQEKTSDEALKFVYDLSENDSKREVLLKLIDKYEINGVFFVSDKEYNNLLERDNNIYPISYLLLSSTQKVYKDVRSMGYDEIQKELIIKKIKEYNKKGIKVLSSLDWILLQDEIRLLESSNVDVQKAKDKINFLLENQVSLVEFLKSNF